MAKAPGTTARDTAPGENFEQVLAELEAIVRKMEDGQLSLSESLSCLKRGMELGNICHRTLDKAEQQVKILMAAEGGHSLQKFSDKEQEQEDDHTGE